MASLTSGAVERAILYCGGEYGRCEIYGRLAKTKHEKEEKDTGMKTEAERFLTGTPSTFGKTPCKEELS